MGLIFIVIANFFWATELILVKKFFPTQNPFIVSAITCITASVFYLPTFFVYKQKFTFQEWVVLFILGLTSWFLAQLFYVTGIQKSQSATAATLVTLTMPFCALLMSMIFLKETLTIKTVIGGLLMLGGFLLVSL